MLIRSTPPIPGPDAIAELTNVEINGTRQALLIRGQNRKAPLLLALHGGPGSAQIGFARKPMQELEQDFVVVQWDQRGSGLSYSSRIPRESFTIEQFVQDAYEVITLLLRRFGQQKLFLVGHSWGTVLGTLVAARYPELIHAYVGMGQVVNMVENEAVSHQYALDQARKQNHQRAIRDLERCRPPYPDFKSLGVQRKWLGKFGGSIRKGTVPGWAMKSILSSTEYTLFDLPRWLQGNALSVQLLWDQLMKVNLTVQVPKLEVPVCFILGRYDYQVPSQLAVAYLEKLEAPSKQLVWFENSAHLLVFEEPDRFVSTMRGVLKTVHCCG